LEDEQMTQFILSFGACHHPWGDAYCIIEAEDYSEARHKVFDKIGTHWCALERIEDLDKIRSYGGREVLWEDVCKVPPASAHDCVGSH
jgi:hypothetical protein